jgi:hypothetical protein
MKKEILIESERIREIMGIKQDGFSVISEQKVLVDILKNLMGNISKDEIKSMEKYFKGEVFDETDRKLLADYLKTTEGKRIIGLMRQEVSKMGDDNVKRKLLYRLRNLEKISANYGSQIAQSEKETAEKIAKEKSEKIAKENAVKKEVETMLNDANKVIDELADKDKLDIIKDPKAKLKVRRNLKKLKSWMENNKKYFQDLTDAEQIEMEGTIETLKQKNPNIFTYLNKVTQNLRVNHPKKFWTVVVLLAIVLSDGFVCSFAPNKFLIKDLCYLVNSAWHDSDNTNSSTNSSSSSSSSDNSGSYGG